MNTLTRAQEDYLKAMYDIGRTNAAIRISDIAETLGVSKPSVCSMAEQLRRAGLAEHERYGTLVLTEKGIRAAVELLSKYEELRSILVDCLGIDEDTARKEACAMEHSIGRETLSRLSALIGKSGVVRERFA